MKPVRADFAPKRAPRRWAWSLLALLCVLVMAAAGALVRQHVSLNEQRAALREVIRQRDVVSIAQPKPSEPPPYARSAQEMLAEHRLAWPKVLTALEATPMLGVTPTMVEIGSNDGLARIEVNFTDHARLLDYLGALNAGQSELQWTLVQAQVQTQTGGGSTAVLRARLTEQ